MSCFGLDMLVTMIPAMRIEGKLGSRGWQLDKANAVIQL